MFVCHLVWSYMYVIHSVCGAIIPPPLMYIVSLNRMNVYILFINVL